LRRSGDDARLEVHQSVRLTRAQRTEVEAEAHRLMDFVAADARQHIWWSGG
jgi:hypothetical protein